MPLLITETDITKLHVDAIVNAANETLLGGGGVDGCIHRAAGPELLAECRTLGGCNPGEAKVTKAYRLPCKYVIHTVGPRWKGGFYNEKETLISCYEHSLDEALKLGCKTVAFPLLSAGIFGYPKADALRIATETIAEFLKTHAMTVYIAILSRASFKSNASDFSDIFGLLRSIPPDEAFCLPEDKPDFEMLENNFGNTFAKRLVKKIDAQNKDDFTLSAMANLDGCVLADIRSNEYYQPKKSQVLAFSLALKLNIKETNALLASAGFTFSDVWASDIIVRYFIEKGNYNIFEINESLFAFGQPLIGE